MYGGVVNRKRVSSQMTEISLDVLMEKMPVSIFHYRLLLMCGLAFCADSMEVSLLAFISVCAGSEWDLSNTEMASITGVVFAGELLGSLFWGPLSDAHGRRFAFVAACLLITMGGALSAFSPSYEILLLTRGIVGFGVGGLTVPYDLLAEFLPSSHRGVVLMQCQYFWTLGSLFVSG
jgi:MFS family permease